MKARLPLCLLLSCLFFFFLASLAVHAAQPPKEAVTVKLAGAKMAPVVLSHSSHVEKQKIDCVKCHHKDGQSPKACTTCHGQAAKDKSPAAKDAFHAMCQNCHKEIASKGKSAPVKCNECHKK